MRVALGQSESEEYQIGLAEIAETLKGNVGLFFTNLEREKVSMNFACTLLLREVGLMGSASCGTRL